MSTAIEVEKKNRSTELTEHIPALQQQACQLCDLFLHTCMLSVCPLRR